MSKCLNMITSKTTVNLCEEWNVGVARCQSVLVTSAVLSKITGLVCTFRKSREQNIFYPLDSLYLNVKANKTKDMTACYLH